MNVDTVNAPLSTAALTLPSSEASNVISSDFETFLKMLTAQARHQDPLEPIDSSEYAAQLAQFSMVEQQVKANDYLALMAEQMGSSSMAGMANWIGMEGRTKAPALFQGQPISIAPSYPDAADAISLMVYDESGALVQKQSLPLTNEPIEWAGVDGEGVPFASGLYTFSIEATQKGEVIANEPAEVYLRITEARNEAGNMMLILTGGQKVTSSSITALREVS